MDEDFLDDKPTLDITDVDTMTINGAVYLNLAQLVERLDRAVMIIDRASVKVVNEYKNAGFVLAGKLHEQATTIFQVQDVLNTILEEKQFEAAIKPLTDGETA